MNEPPATEYQRFVSMLPEDLKKECDSLLTGSGLSPDHLVFKLLADFYEKAAKKAEPEKPPDFFQEAEHHRQTTQQILMEFEKVPAAILEKIEPQLVGLLGALNRPVEKLTGTATDLQRNVEALPHLFVTKLALVGSRMIWLVSGSVCAALAVIVTVVFLYFGAESLSHYYEDAYQERLGALAADSVEDAATLKNLLKAGISIDLERNPQADGYFIILKGVQRAAQPVNSPGGLAVEVWP